MSKYSGFVAVAGVALLFAACAPKVERPTAEMARATTLIDQAEKAGAQRYSAEDLQRARDKLSAADKAANDGKGEVAQRLASEASVDAELAVARAASGDAQRAAREVSRGTDTLQDEAQRNSQQSGTSTTPPNNIP